MRGIKVLPASQLGPAELDNRYIKRFVNGVLAGDTYLGTNATSTEVVLANPNGPIMGGIPLDIASGFLRAGAFSRVYALSDLIRAEAGSGNSASLRFLRALGSPQAPAAAAINTILGSVSMAGYDGTNFSAPSVQLIGTAREAFSPTTRGARWDFRVAQLGATALESVLYVQGGGAGIGELFSPIATLRVVPTTAGQLRNPANTLSMLEWNATGIGEYGNAPIARPTITGSRGGNVALANLLTALNSRGTILDSTTP